MRSKNQAEKKTRSFAKSNHSAGGWHIATLGLLSYLSPFLLFLFSVVNLHSFSFLFVGAYLSDHLIPPPTSGRWGGEGVLIWAQIESKRLDFI